MDTYRNSEIVTAYQVVEPGEQVNTRSGIQWAPSGSWVVFTALGVVIRANEEFTTRYSLWNDGDVDPDPEPEPVYTPVGQTVEQVLAYFAENPWDVARVQAIEAQGANRKGIMDYA